MTRYELLERIGAGGMAEIFRGKAVAAGGFEKPVAIKRILPHLSQDQRFVEMLIAEANTLSQLRHRNIVQIFDVGLGDDGQYFLVMEYVDGTDLGALQLALEQRRKRLPVDLCLHIGAEVCEALEHAHRSRDARGRLRGLVHRDVSPSNVLLSRSGEVKLTDFGIAKRPEEHTGHGGVRGKYAYISPEQAENLHVDGRSDVYSVGIVLYELILGHRLFSKLPDFDALSAVREGHVTRPRDIDPTIDASLERILLRALEREPSRRFDTASAFGAELRGMRYSLPSSGGDPAKEIASIVNSSLRAAPPEPKRRRKAGGKAREEHDHEPTVVRIQTAAGFTMSGFDIRGSRLAHAVDEFDEDEKTRAMSEIPARLPPKRGRARGKRGDTDLERMLGVAPAPDLADALSEAETRLLDRRAPERATPVTDVAPGKGTRRSARGREPSRREPDPRDAAGIEARGERAATPTVRDLFYQGGLLDTDTPMGGTNVVSGGTMQPKPRRRGFLLLLVAAVLVAVGSFFVAQRFLGGDAGGSSGDAFDAGAASD